MVENEKNIYIGEIKTGELNVPVEINKINAITQRETFYKNKTINYILIANKFFNKKETDNILYVPLDQYFQS